jgi:hypothetical protein
MNKNITFTAATALATSLVFAATVAHAQAALDTPENIASAMQSCAVIARAHDYDADDQDMEIPWTRITERSASFGLQGAPATVSANVWGSDTSGNSYCDFLFQDEELMQNSFDLFMTDRTPISFDDQDGICFEGTFLVVYATGPDGIIAKTAGVQGYITVHNTPQYGDDPCAS